MACSTSAVAAVPLTTRPRTRSGPWTPPVTPGPARAHAGGPVRAPHGGAGWLLYVVGGDGETSRVLIYDPASDTWSTGAEMPVHRNHLAAVAADGRVWAIGGRVAAGIQDRVDIYDPATDTWSSGPPLPEATSAASEGVLGSVIVISGGEAPGAGRPHRRRPLAAGHRRGRRRRMEAAGSPAAGRARRPGSGAWTDAS